MMVHMFRLLIEGTLKVCIYNTVTCRTPLLIVQCFEVDNTIYL
jgi:hypothetical protein